MQLERYLMLWERRAQSPSVMFGVAGLILVAYGWKVGLFSLDLLT